VNTKNLFPVLHFCLKTFGFSKFLSNVFGHYKNPRQRGKKKKKKILQSAHTTASNLNLSQTNFMRLQETASSTAYAHKQHTFFCWFSKVSFKIDFLLIEVDWSWFLVAFCLIFVDFWVNCCWFLLILSWFVLI